jgi:hypothetical protein
MQEIGEENPGWGFGGWTVTFMTDAADEAARGICPAELSHYLYLCPASVIEGFWDYHRMASRESIDIAGSDNTAVM